MAVVCFGGVGVDVLLDDRIVTRLLRDEPLVAQRSRFGRRSSCECPCHAEELRLAAVPDLELTYHRKAHTTLLCRRGPTGPSSCLRGCGCSRRPRGRGRGRPSTCRAAAACAGPA